MRVRERLADWLAQHIPCGAWAFLVLSLGLYLAGVGVLFAKYSADRAAKQERRAKP